MNPLIVLGSTGRLGALGVHLAALAALGDPLVIDKARTVEVPLLRTRYPDSGTYTRRAPRPACYVKTEAERSVDDAFNIAEARARQDRRNTKRMRVAAGARL